MVLHFQFDLFRNRNLRANIRTRKDIEKAQLILNREQRKQKVQVEFEVKTEGKKKKKKYDGVADVAQQDCNNNKYSASTFIYIYIYIFINGIQFQVFYWTSRVEFIGNLEPILK